jgi:hypothetical protein
MIQKAFYKLSATQIYLDWVNNWLTPQRMADYYNVSVKTLTAKIDAGRTLVNIETVQNNERGTYSETGHAF